MCRGGIASLNANHFWGNCESLWHSDSPKFFGTANHIWPIVNYFSNGYAKTFFILTPFSRQNFPFLNKYSVYGTKMRINYE